MTLCAGPAHEPAARPKPPARRRRAPWQLLDTNESDSVSCDELCVGVKKLVSGHAPLPGAPGQRRPPRAQGPTHPLPRSGLRMPRLTLSGSLAGPHGLGFCLWDESLA